MSKREILNYINVFRGLAILMIVAGHTMQIGSSLLHDISFEIVSGGTALFIFISGFLFEYLSDKFDYIPYLKKKWTNVVMPYIITAIPGILLYLTIPQPKNPFAGLNPILQSGIFLSIGRVHNVPTWYIPMIVIFFLLSYLMLKHKKLLYKLLPILFLITVFVPRMVIEPEFLVNMTYGQKYLEYVKYILNGFVHFASMYVLGMYFSSKKELIEKCFDLRGWIWALMILTATMDIYLNYKYNIVNGTISKIFFTLLALGYLKHYDEKIKNCKWFNSTMDVIAKYSFGIFFVHWYVFQAYLKLTGEKGIVPVNSPAQFFSALATVSVRFVVVTGVSFLILLGLKKLLEKLKVQNTRSFIGV